MPDQPYRRATPAPSADDGTARNERSSTLRFILTLAILAWVVRSLIIAPFSIPSGSMLPTLYIGDYVAVAKWPYGYARVSFPFGFPPIEGRLLGGTPKRGDVVVFRHPTENADLIKRVIGVPGDMVEVRGGTLILNGRVVPRQPLGQYPLPISANTPCKTVPPALPAVETRAGEPKCIIPAFRESLPGGPTFTTLDQVTDGAADNFSAVRVPAGHIFLMGDNRDDSLDSRFGPELGGIGMVPVENVIGRALVTFWSTDGSASYVKPWTWFSALRGGRMGNGYSGAAE
ncbi:MAG: signal peptidase I [Sphingomicrobium sp.]